MSIPDADIPPDVFAEWFIAVFAALLIWMFVADWIGSFRSSWKRSTLLGLAVITGFTTTLSVSPFGTVATQLTELSTLIPQFYPELVSKLVAAETAFMFVYGLYRMSSGGGVLGILLYLSAFLGGLLVLYLQTVGFLLIGFPFLVAEVWASEIWGRRGLSRGR